MNEINIRKEVAMKNKKMSIIRLSVMAVLLTLGFVFGSGAKAAWAAESIQLNVEEVAIAKDGVFRLRVYNVPSGGKVTFKSTDTSVAFVDSRGYITGISNGECFVTATVQVGGSVVGFEKCSVTVGPAAISIKLTKSEIVLGVGMKKTLKTIISPLNTVEKPVFYSVDKTVASVTSIGRVRAKGVGETSIFAFLLNGETAECKVYVLDEEDYKKYNATGTLVGIIEGYSEPGDDKDKNVDENTENPEKDDTVDDEGDESEEKQKDTSKESSKTETKDSSKESAKEAATGSETK
jgi:hypothetical protein